MKYLVILAARMSSSRLPGKAMLSMDGVPIIQGIIQRLKPGDQSYQICLATSDLKSDDVLSEVATIESINVCRGSLENVLDRFVQASELYSSEYIIRATGDCPFIHHELVKLVIDFCNSQSDFDLVTTKPSFPSGIDLEVIPTSLLKKIHQSNPTSDECEHIFNFIYNRSDEYRVVRMEAPNTWKTDQQFLLDSNEDFEKLNSLKGELKFPDFTLTELLVKNDT